MELKILILDDEYIILDGLCSFPWEMYGCRIVGKAMDGDCEKKSVNKILL
ncbi:MAG: hypothetical protein WAV19_13690 [Blautia wexlerae]